MLTSKFSLVMPYDPTLPADHTPIVAAELRAQFNGLNAARAPRVDAVNPLSYPTDVSPQDPITSDLLAKLNELIAALQQP